jgi:hypothetical protein
MKLGNKNRYLTVLSICTAGAIIPFLSHAQQIQTQNFSSTGGNVTSIGTQRLVSVVGQPIVYNTAVLTEPKAGFLQVVSEVITDVQVPTIIYTTPNQGITQGATGTFTATIFDNIKLDKAFFYYKPITSPASEFKSIEITGTGTVFAATIQNDYFDNIGMEYYFKAVDASDNSSVSPPTGSYYSYLSIPLVQIPATVLSAGTADVNYRIIALPYTAEGGEAILDVFSNPNNKLPEHKNSEWRLATYQAAPTGFIEYPGVLNKFERGHGYWFIQKEAHQIILGPKTVLPNNRKSLFTMTLTPGWNMVGNPYPIPIKWSDVQGFPGNSVGDLHTYTAGGWKTESDLAAFQGGFVNNLTSANISITIPFSGQTILGGRTRNFDPGTDISAPEWKVKLNLYQATAFNELGGFGMTSAAAIPDELYDFNPPSFVDGPEINFDSPLKKLCRSIVTFSKENSWRFTASGITGQDAEIRWNDSLGSGSEPLYLLDEQNLMLTNMRETSSYSFKLTSGHTFNIFYGAEKITSRKIQIAPPYPNPAANQKTTFTLGLPESTTPFDVGLQLYNSNGSAINTMQKSLSSGIHSFVWDAGENVASGIYYYRILVKSGNGIEVSTGKIVLP